MKGLLVILGLILILVAVARLVVSRLVYKGFKLFKTAAERAAEDEEYFKRTSNKYYRKEVKEDFDADYFKGQTETVEQKRQKEERIRRENARRTTTSSGVTIIDERDPHEAGRKIFSDGEGEYTDFEVVSD